MGFPFCSNVHRLRPVVPKLLRGPEAVTWFINANDYNGHWGGVLPLPKSSSLFNPSLSVSWHPPSKKNNWVTTHWWVLGPQFGSRCLRLIELDLALGCHPAQLGEIILPHFVICFDYPKLFGAIRKPGHLPVYHELQQIKKHPIPIQILGGCHFLLMWWYVTQEASSLCTLSWAGKL